MAFNVYSWWSMLCAVSLLNLVAWVAAAGLLGRRKALLPTNAYTLRRWQLALSAVYVLGCGFRSVLPVYDVPRLCLFDTWLSSVVVGRSVASVAELCFAMQWALMLHEASRQTGNAVGRRVSMLIVPLIVVAEGFSWYSVLTTSNIGHVIEESLWGLAATLLVFSLAALWPRIAERQRQVLALWCGVGLAYVAFMFVVDVPMYWSRWLADEASGRHYLSLAQGWLDVSARWVVSTSWQRWQTEVTWMSLYFSVAVWFSIGLVHAPIFTHRRTDPRLASTPA